jgi:hypothetical protein
MGMNLRGVKESVLNLLPIFLASVLMHSMLVVYAIVSRAPELPIVFSNPRASRCAGRLVRHKCLHHIHPIPTRDEQTLVEKAARGSQVGAKAGRK